MVLSGYRRYAGSDVERAMHRSLERAGIEGAAAMDEPVSTFRFSLRGLFVTTAFVGFGLAALRYPYSPVLLILGSITVLLFAYAAVMVLASTGRRRLFWAAFATTAVAVYSVRRTVVPVDLCRQLARVLSVPVISTDPSYRQDLSFNDVVFLLHLLMVSTLAAYIIPWLVQRGQKPPQTDDAKPAGTYATTRKTGCDRA